MKKRNLFIVGVLAIFAFTLKASASTCSDERNIKLSTLSGNVNVSYEKYNIFYGLREDEQNDVSGLQVDSYPGFKLAIYNLPSELNAAVIREDTKKALVANSTDADSEGVILIDTGEATSVKNFTIQIRSNDSNCKNEVLRTITVTTPMYNRFYDLEACANNKEYSLCQEFTNVDYSDIDEVEFAEKVEKYVEEKKAEEERKNSLWGKISYFISKYYIYFIIAVILVAGIVCIRIYRRKKSRLV